MKLLRDKACHSALARGNVKRLTVMGEVLMDGFSDRGSIPLTSILDIHVLVILAKSVEHGTYLGNTGYVLFSYKNN